MLERLNLSIYGGSVWDKLSTNTELVRRLTCNVSIDVVAGDPYNPRKLCLYHRDNVCGVHESGIFLSVFEYIDGEGVFAQEILRLFSYRGDRLEHALALEYFYYLMERYGFHTFPAPV